MCNLVGRCIEKLYSRILRITDTLSRWFIKNESLLFKESEAKVMFNENGLPDNSDCAHKSFKVTETDTLLGQFTQKLTERNESMSVYLNLCCKSAIC